MQLQGEIGAVCEVVAMTDADQLRAVFSALEVNDTFTQAVVRLNDDSELRLVHRVGERTVRASGKGNAASLLAKIARFRLNAKHLEIQFADGSRWEAKLGA